MSNGTSGLLQPFALILEHFNEDRVRAVKLRLLEGVWEVTVTTANADGDYIKYRLTKNEGADKWKRLP